jgi:hypothetical protein
MEEEDVAGEDWFTSFMTCCFISSTLFVVCWMPFVSAYIEWDTGYIKKTILLINLPACYYLIAPVIGAANQ